MKKLNSFLFIILILICSKTELYAKYREVVVKNIPIERLIKNLEAQKAENIDDEHSWYALGRLYAMAYTLQKDSVPSIRLADGGGYVPYYGYPVNLPHFFKVDISKRDPSKFEFSKKFLDKAVENFEQAVSLNPEDVPCLLGLGWCYEQRGDRAEAMALYRKILKMNVKNDVNGVSSIETAEAAGYLLAMLNPETNKEETDTLKAKISRFKPQYIVSPILVPMKSGIQFESLIEETPSVWFDLDASGVKQEWQWIKPNAAWLVFKPKDGQVSAYQMFGNHTFNINWENGFEALSSLDDNKDGVLDKAELSEMAYWQDLNSNGVTEKGELIDVLSEGVITINYKNYKTINNRLLQNTGAIQYSNGQQRDAFDWWPTAKPQAL